MNVKKTLAGIASYALVGAVALGIGGTLAFDQDEESKMNTLSTGDAVDIVINEYQRSAGDDSPLEDFEQGKPLYPIEGSAQESPEGEPTKMDTWGMPTAAAAKNYVDKMVTVQNTGQADAYVRVFVAIPTALLGDDIEDDSDDVLHWNWGNRVKVGGGYKKEDYELADWGWAWQKEDKTLIDPEFHATIDDQEYVVSTFYFKNALSPEEATTAVMGGLYLDTNVDYDNGVYMRGDKVINYDFSKGVTVPVFADAVVAAGAADYASAFAGRPAVEVFEAWASEVSAPVLVETADEFEAALAAGGELVLTENIELTSDTTTLEKNVNITFEEDITANRSDSSGADKYSTLTIMGTTTLDGSATLENKGGYAISVRDDDAALTIKGGTYKGGTTAINVVKGDLVITGGTFIDTDEDGGDNYSNGHYLINCIDGNYNSGAATVTIIGGTFKNWNPADNASEGAGTSFVPAGYHVESEVIDGATWYTVVAD